MTVSNALIIRCDKNPAGGHEDFRAAVVSAVPRGAYFEFGGGLGDVVTLASQTDVFRRLDEDGDAPVVVVLVTHNPHAWELFAFHPRADRLVILDLPISEIDAGYDRHGEQFRRRHGLPVPPVEPRPAVLSGFRPCPIPEDLEEIARVQEPFAVLATTASCGPSDSRTIPPEIVSDCARTLIDDGIRPVFVGRNYTIGNRTHPSVHAESKRVYLPWMVSMVDRLTVPGSLELVRRAVLTVACDSAIGCAARAMLRPTFHLTSDAMWAACGGSEAGHGTMYHPAFYNCSYRAYTDGLLREFLRRHIR